MFKQMQTLQAPLKSQISGSESTRTSLGNFTILAHLRKSNRTDKAPLGASSNCIVLAFKPNPWPVQAHERLAKAVELKKLIGQNSKTIIARHNFLEQIVAQHFFTSQARHCCRPGRVGQRCQGGRSCRRDPRRRLINSGVTFSPIHQCFIPFWQVRFITRSFTAAAALST